MSADPSIRLAVLPVGDRAFVVELASVEQVLAVFSELARTRPAGVIDVVPAARTVGVTVDPARLTLSAATAWATAAAAGAVTASGSATAPVSTLDAPTVEIPVAYTGADLAEVARMLRMPEADVVAIHTGSTWRVAFSGFAPGFAYLVTDHARLHVPRRSTPRTVVPAGSVALAGEFSGVYPRQSPGGWNLIGTTDAVIWDASRTPPALLTPGAVVRFTEAG